MPRTFRPVRDAGLKQNGARNRRVDHINESVTNRAMLRDGAFPLRAIRQNVNAVEIDHRPD